ncbi:hypothetical protein BJ508DRAFT_326624 [Ascobolus immersus RN42]|uniref:Protein-S-isoprenylcysteine O-methyltransferase n=1 Tax=Ascobolus immersus RN42 TaxID=1160509 RepID=A0A3N4IAM3_ASCIM|nr:hypothetical protein BJ508DRAFT_326624 [Ascobolus immersus RN42]
MHFTKLLPLTPLTLLPIIHPYLPGEYQNYHLHLTISQAATAFLFIKFCSPVNPTPEHEVDRGPILAVIESVPSKIFIYATPIVLAFISIYQALTATSHSMSVGPDPSLYFLTPIFLIALAIRYLSVNSLGRQFVFAFVTPKKLVDSGPYAWVRHPGYISTLLLTPTTYLMTGMDVLPEVWNWGLGAFMAVLFLAWTVERVAIEEKLLSRRVAGYEEYKRRVRWKVVPGIW